MAFFTKYCLCFVLFLAALVPLCGGETDDSYQSRIVKIEIEGLRRTKPFVLDKYLNKYLGMKSGDIDLNDVNASIIDTGILEPVRIEIKRGEAGDILFITVDEKITIIPLPFFFAGTDGLTAGFGFMDANFLGINDKLILAALYSAERWLAFASFAHTPQHAYLPGWGVGGSFSQSQTENTNQKKEVYRRYKNNRASFFTSVNYSLNEFAASNLRFSFTNISLFEDGDDLNAPDGGVSAAGMRPGVSLKQSEWDGYFLSNQNLSIGYDMVFILGGESAFYWGEGSTAQHLQVQAVYEKPIIPGFRVKLKASAAYSPFSIDLFEISPSEIADILPKGFTASHYAGAQIGLEKYIYKWKAGTLSLTAAYEAVLSQGPVLDDQFDHGFAAAIVFYVSKLAIPAVGLGVCYNVRADYLQSYFTIGMSF
jgi:hypothetical protein